MKLLTIMLWLSAGFQLLVAYLNSESQATATATTASAGVGRWEDKV